MTKNAGAFFAIAAASVAVLFMDTGNNLFFLVQIHSWGIGAYALVNGLSCLLLVALSEWLEKKLKIDNPYITVAGMFMVFISRGQ